MNVVLFKVSDALGDNVVFLPAVQALARHCPDWNLHLLTTRAHHALYQGMSPAVRLIVADKRPFDLAYRHPWRLAKWMRKVRSLEPKACLLSFDQSSVAHLLAKASGAALRIGSQLKHIKVPGSVTVEVPRPPDDTPLTWHWRMATELVRAFGRAEGWPEAPSRPDLSHLLTGGVPPKASRPRIVLHPGSSKPLTRWPADRFAEVGLALARDAEVIWIRHRDSLPPPAQVHSVEPSGLPELASWLASSDLVVCNNSGPMHLANALGCRGVVVTGPTALGWNPYWDPQKWTILRHPALRCAPCETVAKVIDRCTNLSSPLACLSYWTPSAVVDACQRQLGIAGRAP